MTAPLPVSFPDPVTKAPAPDSGPVDVNIVVEGCYPFISGGVSSWLDWLIRSRPETSFGVTALVADARPREIKYAMPPNVRFLDVVALRPDVGRPSLLPPAFDVRAATEHMLGTLTDGRLDAFEGLVNLASTPVGWRALRRVRPPLAPGFGELMNSEPAWRMMTGCYDAMAPCASFSDFFWAWRSLVGGLVSAITAPVREARCYHAISTGYAGLYCAGATVRTGRPFAITEHGIYTNERRIDLVTAEWIRDRVAVGMGAPDARRDVRDFWIETFEAFARIAYQAATSITTLYGANQFFQRAMGAAEEKLSVIPNGIALGKFDALPPRPEKTRPTMALIGRVVPIKDIEAFIAAAAIVKRSVPDVDVLMIGPTDEDEAYHALCMRRVEESGLGDAITFTGKVNVFDYLSRIDVLVLTSISEAQPLVLLEAGAARVPCVATDVGSCREIIEGAPGEDPPLGSGGRVCAPMDEAALGAAVVELLGDDALRHRCGEVLRTRVERHFTSEASSARYSALYDALVAA